MNSPCWTLSMWCTCVVTTSTVFAAGGTAATGDACSVRPWNATNCCSGTGSVIQAVSGGSLSVTECDAVNGSNIAGLEWNHATLQEDGWDLLRISLFSHCINPTNTSLVLPPGTLLFSSDRSHRTSSTTITQPASAICSYFGCYEAYFGFYIYTFAEVSCTAKILQIPMPTSTIDISHTLQNRNTLMSDVTEQSSSVVFGSSLSTLLTVASQTLEKSVGHISSNPTTTQSPMPGGIGTHMWHWLIPLLLNVLLLIAGTVVLAVIKFCTQSWRNDTKESLWHTIPDQSSDNSADSPSVTIRDLDKSSFHSVHTLYEDMDVKCAQKLQVDNDCSEQCISKDECKEDLPVVPPDTTTTTNGASNSQTTSGISSCDTDTSYCCVDTDCYDNNAGSSNGSTNMKFYSLNSLIQELSSGNP